MLLPELGCFQARPARARARACWLAVSRILSLARSAGCARIAIHREDPSLYGTLDTYKNHLVQT